MDNHEVEKLKKALVILKAAQFINHPYTQIAHNSTRYKTAIANLIELSGDSSIGAKGAAYAPEWEKELREKAIKDTEKSSDTKPNSGGGGWKKIGTALVALIAVGTVGGVAGVALNAHNKKKKQKEKKTGE